MNGVEGAEEGRLHPSSSRAHSVDKEEKSSLANGQVLSRQPTPRLFEQRRFCVAEGHRWKGLEEAD